MDGGLIPLFLFPTYANREAALKEGIPESVMPPFDPTKPRKCWYDPNPPAPDDEGNCVYSVVAHTLLGTPRLGLDGTPFYTKLRLPPAQARTMNIASSVPPDPPNIGEVPMPCRPLAADEEFVPNGFAGWKVQKKSPPASQSAAQVVSTQMPAIMERFDRIDAQLKAIIEELTARK